MTPPRTEGTGSALTLSQALAHVLSAYKARNFVAAERICRQILAIKSDSFDAYHLLAMILAAQGKNDLAVAGYDRALALKPDDAVALYNRGVVLHEMRRYGEAVASFDRALAGRPGDAKALGNRAASLHALQRYDDAAASYDGALLVYPNNADMHYFRGLALTKAKRFDEALASYDRALALRPDYAEALNNRGITLGEQGRFDEALASYDRALAARPDHAEALNNRGVALNATKRFAAAVASFDRAIETRPDNADAFNNRGVALYELRRFAEAIASYDRAIALQPNDGDALFNRGNALRETMRWDEALASYDRALAVRPDYADALTNRGNVLQEMKRLDEALDSYARALAANPHDPHAFSGAANSAAKLCDWDKRSQFAAALPATVRAGEAIVSPFLLLGYSDDPALQLRCAQNHVAHRLPVPPAPLWTGGTRRHDKIRVAYLSADFRTHPGAHLIAGLIESHDRAAFEIFGISFGIDDGSPMRQRLVAAFDRFHDVRDMTDEDTAKLLFDLEIDIAIDRNGHTRDSRPAILAHRPAPIQASYLGYPGTTGAAFIDYIVTDKIVAPFEHAQFFTEKIVHLPDCYQANDDKRRIAEATPTRREMGLPEQGFVFCCFNNNWKITPAMFDIWMRLLHRVDGSVLWLLRDNDGAERNLRQEAARRGIDPSRLVFAARIPLEAHLARHRLADLFLDTLPYNAHTTASDALWLGLPVVTTMGQTFAARVAASILHAIGMPELIAADLAGYEALALRLAHDPALLASTKAKLTRNRDTHPLFDTARFTRHIEDAYRTMWDIHQRGETPRSFAVAPR